MSDQRVSFSERVYAVLIRAYPRSFRDEYGEELQNFFRDQLREYRREKGSVRVSLLWLRAIRDIASMSAGAHLQQMGERSKAAKQNSTPIRKATMTSAISQDFRYTIRALRKNPIFTWVAIAVIALGTGAVSTIFSVGNSLILRPIAGVTRATELVTIERVSKGSNSSLSASYKYYQELANRSKTMTGIAAWSTLKLTISSGAEGVASFGNIVSGNYFEVLGVKPVIGRFFIGDERVIPDAFPVVVISNEFWKRQFAGDSTIVGNKILINGTKFDVIGVAPPGFSGLYPLLRTDVWVPIMMQRAVRRGGDLLSSDNSAWLELFGRVGPRANMTTAQTDLAAITKQRADRGEEPQFMRSINSVRLAKATGFPSDATNAVMTFFLVLLVVAILVLIIASVNVASMLLARAVARRREIAVRIALGAGRARLIRQLLTECVVLFTLGGLAGTALAVIGTSLLRQINLPVDVPMMLNVSPDFRVLAVTMLIALATGIGSGLAPALRGSQMDIASTLRSDNNAAGRRQPRLRNSLVIGQVALSLLLLTVSGLFVRALDKGRRVDIGFDVANVSAAALNIGTAGYDSTRAREFYRSLAERISAITGVENVSYSRTLPLSMNSTGEDVTVVDPVEEGGSNTSNGRPITFPASENVVDRGYFDVVKMPILAGRDFNSRDNENAAHVVVINEAFAKKYWAGQNAVGKLLKMDSVPMTVVGVVRNAKYTRLDENRAPFMFLPHAQHFRADVNLLVRSIIRQEQMAKLIRQEVHTMDANLPVPVVTTLEQATAVVLLPQRTAVLVTGILGIAGLLLAAIGLYGVISFSTAQRTREIGVRVALGAARSDVLRLVVAEGMNLVAIGMAIGLALALVATRALTSFLFGVSPLDGLTFVAVAAILGVCALLASYLPARRAAKVDPMVALRQD